MALPKITGKRGQWDALAELVRAEPLKYWEMVDSVKDAERMGVFMPDDDAENWFCVYGPLKSVNKEFYTNEYKTVLVKEFYGNHYVFCSYEEL